MATQWTSFFETVRTASNVVQTVVQAVGNSLPSRSQSHVCEISAKQQTQLVELQKDGSFMLCHLKTENKYHVAFEFSAKGTKKILSVFHSDKEDDAAVQFHRFKHEFLLFEVIAEENEQAFRMLVDKFHANTTWSSIHYAAALGCSRYVEMVKSDGNLSGLLTSSSSPKGKLPLHLAIEGMHSTMVQALLKAGANACAVDADEENAFHYAAKTTPEIINMLAEACDSTDGINHQNAAGVTPLSIAIAENSPTSVKLVEALLAAGANAMILSGGSYPIEDAVTLLNPAAAADCTAAFLRSQPDAICEQNPLTGNTLFHLDTTKLIFDILLPYAAAKPEVLAARNKKGDTALHIQTRKNELGCVLKLLAAGAAVNVGDHNGNTCIFLAIENGNLQMIKALLIFGADPNLLNNQGHTARHFASLSSKLATIEQKKTVGKLLETCGSKRCESGKAGCTSCCGFHGSESASELNSNATSIRAGLDEFCDDVAVAHLLSLREQAKSSSEAKKPINLLCLDGGGIRGLILVQILIELERQLGEELFSKFGLLAGTSTGGIVAIGLCVGKSLRDCQRLYFRFKDAVFSGFMRPYNTEILEKFLKQEFTDTKTLADFNHTKLVITSVLADKHPVRLSLFRNFRLPLLSDAENNELGYSDPRDHLLWKVARCTSAAPSYFSSVDGRFLDGGLIANNPTLDVLSEVEKINTCYEYKGKPEQTVKIGCVLSIGTGINPEIPITSKLDVGLPDNPVDAFLKAFAVRDLSNMLVDQVTATDGCPVERARSWCQMLNIPFFRFSTPLSVKVELDTKADDDCLRMLWDTIEYMNSPAVKQKVQKLVGLLKGC